MEASTASLHEGPEQLLARVEELQGRLDAVDPAARGVADELIAATLQMYGAGLERIVELLQADGEDGKRIALGLSEDQLVSTLLLIHDLHPVPLADRVQSALESVRPYMESHGGNVELLSLEDRVARIHLQGSCSDCAASSVTLELAIKQALEDVAPDLEGLEVEGVAPQIAGVELPVSDGAQPGSGLELPMVQVSPGPSAPAWFEVPGVAELPEGSIVALAVSGADLAIANVDGTLLAYRNSCASCGEPIDEGQLTAGAIACPQCDRSFFLPRAGRSMDDDRLQLDPVPLLRENGTVKVALGQ